MIVVTMQDVLAHQTVVAWPTLRQVEQDLLLCLAMVAIFSDPVLSTQVAMRGGTVLHKIYLAPAARYSEDIDLVVIDQDVTDDDVKQGIQQALRGLFGEPQGHAWLDLKLALRNTFKPSRILKCVYDVASVSVPGSTLRIEVEVNVTERHPYKPLSILPFSFTFQDEPVHVGIVSFDIHEMMGTKLRALLQRRKGRDLFDVYWALTSTAHGKLSGTDIIACFRHYMKQENSDVTREHCVAHLAASMANPGFRSDMRSLLVAGVHYDVAVAAAYVEAELLAKLD